MISKYDRKIGFVNCHLTEMTSGSIICSRAEHFYATENKLVMLKADLRPGYFGSTFPNALAKKGSPTALAPLATLYAVQPCPIGHQEGDHIMSSATIIKEHTEQITEPITNDVRQECYECGKPQCESDFVARCNQGMNLCL
jgi:hypothetical protein